MGPDGKYICNDQKRCNGMGGCGWIGGYPCSMNEDCYTLKCVNGVCVE
jgi:hypothetical protein